MVNNTELSSKVKAQSQEPEATERDVSQLLAWMESMQEALNQLVVDLKKDRQEKEQMNGVCSSNSGPPLNPPHGGHTSDVSHQQQHEVITTGRELNGRTDFHHSAAHHEVDRNASLDVSDFCGDHNSDLFFDWVHNMDAFFEWYDIQKGANSSFLKPS